MVSSTISLSCPLDGESLKYNTNHYLCPNGHSFDIARQGYVNLLPVQHKRSKQPGDSKAMVLARKQFLDEGIYRPVAEKLVETINLYSVTNDVTSILDAGCGEGYYLDFLYRQNSSENEYACLGLDISKEAIIEAAKRNKDIAWVVGTNRNPPVLEKSIDIIFSIFGFHSFEGFAKAIKNKGNLIVVEPNKDHLRELRNVIYEEDKEVNSFNESLATQQGFKLLENIPLQFKTKALNQKLIANLLLMTPHFFRANKEGLLIAQQLNDICLTVDMTFRIFEFNSQ